MEQVLVDFLDDLEVISPCQHKNMAVYGLKRKSRTSALDYLTLQEAVAHQKVRVEEESQQGSVPNLRVVNEEEQDVLLIDGEELVGAKQNRVLNTSILIPKKSHRNIPVSCVEQGRWRYTSSSFTSGSVSHISLRKMKSSHVTQNLKHRGSYESNQGEIWQEVASKTTCMGTQSCTMALNDVYRDYAGTLNEFKNAFAGVKDVVGVLVAINGEFQCADIFDKPQTMAKMQPRLIEGYALDAIEIGKEDQQYPVPSTENGREFLQKALKSKVDRFPSLGAGDDLRLESESLVGSCLTYHNEVVHMGLFNAQTSSRRSPTT